MVTEKERPLIKLETVHFFAMPDIKDNDFPKAAIDTLQDAMLTLPNTVYNVARMGRFLQFDRASWKWVQ